MVINQSVKYKTPTDHLSVVFAALADPTRRSMLARLSVRSATVNELALPYDMSLPAVSKHLKVLEQAGLISTTKDAQYRPKRLESSSLRQATTWLDDYRKLWEHNLNNLDTYLHEVQLSNKEG
ncbi:MAG TPA: metalloregulator ArsR/SmtB family transcription factor [Candidatus Saccharimonadales bacterium]|nr:metalloregulator ArsR/SmtB family transcription factor [Candidatus Saccharimonadales bacterium]